MEDKKTVKSEISREKGHHGGGYPGIGDAEIFIRMNLAERIQHFILFITFSILIVTGLPLMFYEIKFFKWIYSFPRGFYIRGILHRMAAVALILSIIWHILYTIFSERGRNNFKELIPRFKDFKDAFETFWHNVGLTRFLYRRGILKKFFKFHPYWLFKKPPEFGRYNFIEKFEYWAAAWGSLIMIISGFFMWNVEFSLSLFPLWVHHIFIIVHGYEALLGFLAVIIWHMYSVHLNPEVFPMSKVWLTGKITGKELLNLHPLEYKKILEERKKGVKMIIAELSIFPTSEGTSVSRYVKEAIRIIESTGLYHETGGMSTTIEAPDMETLFKVVKECHEAMVKMGVKRIHIDLKVDHRLDKEATIDSKLKAIGKR